MCFDQSSILINNHEFQFRNPAEIPIFLGIPLINTDKVAITGIKNYEIRSQKQSCIFYLDLQKFMEDQTRARANNHSHQRWKERYNLRKPFFYH